VLLVEDHVDTVNVLRRLLTASGHAVMTAQTAVEALALAKEHIFDLIVSDLGLPDMTGYEMMKEMKQRSEAPGIAISGYGMEEDIKKSRLAGFSEHIVKPVSLAQLEQCIRRVAMESPSGEREN
jgi:CheY-like chemotaxis protein